jgi:hypothetical protein
MVAFLPRRDEREPQGGLLRRIRKTMENETTRE